MTEVLDGDEVEPADGPAGEAESGDTPETESADAEAGEAGSAGESETAPGTASRRLGPGRWTWIVLGVSIVAVVAAYLAWRDADTDPDLARAQLRDQAIIEGTSAVETMNSMDYRDVPTGLKAWLSVTTGVLHDQLTQIGEDERKLLADPGMIAKGHVVEAALTQLTDRTATLIAAVETTVQEKDPAKEPTVKRNRYSADLVLVGGTWKIENLAPVPVSMS